jgi:hypothetical protein
MIKSRVLRILVLWGMLSVLHLGLWAGSFYPANYYTSQLKVAPTPQTEWMASVFNTAHHIFSIPVSYYREPIRSESVLAVFITLQCLAWGLAWLTLFLFIQRFLGRRTKTNAG